MTSYCSCNISYFLPSPVWKAGKLSVLFYCDISWIFYWILDLWFFIFFIFFSITYFFITFNFIWWSFSSISSDFTWASLNFWKASSTLSYSFNRIGLIRFFYTSSAVTLYDLFFLNFNSELAIVSAIFCSDESSIGI